MRPGGTQRRSLSMTGAPITVLGIDPGLTVTGYGFVRIDGDRHIALDFGAVAPPTQAPIAERLLRIHDALADVIRDVRPDEVAVEDFIVGHVRAAVALCHCLKRGSPIASESHAPNPFPLRPAPRGGN